MVQVDRPQRLRLAENMVPIKEIDYSGKPEKIPLSLDTQEYVFDKQGETYQFLARGSEKPEVSSWPDVISVEFAGT